MARPKTHCKRGHELTPSNLYVAPGDSKRHCRECRKENSKTDNVKNRLHRAGTQRARRRHHRVPSESPEAKRSTVLRSIGWTQELFDAVMVEQSNKCAICRKEMNLKPVQNAARACADHAHCVPPKPREILCSTCNTALGLLKEDPEIMRAMIDYTLKHRGGVKLWGT